VESKVSKNSGVDENTRLLEYHPRTELGQRLWNIRQRIVSSGIPLLDWDDIEREVADRRGQSPDNQA